MIIILNNGTRIKVNNDTVQSIIQNIIKGDAKNWQLQLDGQNAMAPLSAINLSQVAAICGEEDIINESGDTLRDLGKYLDSVPVEDSQMRYWAERFRRFVTDKNSML